MFDYFEYFASKGNHPDKNKILDLENIFIFEEFDESKIHQIIENACQIALQLYQKNIGIRICFKDQINQYLMEGIKEDWLLRKEKVCLETKHSSYYIFLDNIDNHIYDYMINDESYGICGGSFPLIVNNDFVGAITCTGLRPHEDHQVIIETLKNILNKGEMK